MAKTHYVDQDVCINCGVCTDMVPDVFRTNDDDKAEVHNPDGASEDDIQGAIDNCPVSCIHWH